MKSLFLINLHQLVLISYLDGKLSKSCSITIKKLKDLGGYAYEELSEVSPDHHYLAYTMFDKDNDHFKLSVRDLNFVSLCSKPQADRVSSIAYGQALLHVVTDKKMSFRLILLRIYCSMLGSSDEDVLLMVEPQEYVHLNIRHIKDFCFLTVNAFSTQSSKLILCLE